MTRKLLPNTSMGVLTGQHLTRPSSKAGQHIKTVAHIRNIARHMRTAAEGSVFRSKWGLGVVRRKGAINGFD